MLLSTDHERRNAWPISASGGKLDVMQKIREWIKGRLTTEEMICFYAQTLREGRLAPCSTLVQTR